ncbi:hypothetical protein [Bacillus cereus]|uniref:Uncharacterized protein n=1 Tax=Bacillus cereus VD184 TaxID=1053242 RepID=A0A9W5R376_BACCE|nr:hypothetical protein [Bacillus cereus]EOQ06082.1 hypothetical protein IKC_01064 [Bacillus cereus VD184]
MEGKEKLEECKESAELIEEIEIKETEKTEVLEDASISKVEPQSSLEGALSRMQSMISAQEKLNKSIEVVARSTAAQNQVAETIKQIAAAGERVARVVVPISQQVANQIHQIQQTISPIAQQIVNQVHALSDVFDSVGAIGQRIQTALNAFDYYDKLSDLREMAQRHEEATLKFKTIMVELGFPPHDFMRINITGRIIQMYEEKGAEYTRRFIERFMCMFVYNKEILIEMRNSWQQAEWLEKRLPIISTAVEGHLNGYYTLTVPAILAQMEGILVEGILKLEAVAPDEQIKFRHQKSFLGQFLLGDKGSFSFDEQIEEFYLNTVLANFDRGKEVESDLSRHAILHGEDVNYGTKVNSLKCILIFDYLFDKLHEAYKDIEKSKLEIKRQKEIEQSKKRTRNASGKKPKGYRKKVAGNYHS